MQKISVIRYRVSRFFPAQVQYFCPPQRIHPPSPNVQGLFEMLLLLFFLVQVLSLGAPQLVSFGHDRSRARAESHHHAVLPVCCKEYVSCDGGT